MHILKSVLVVALVIASSSAFAKRVEYNNCKINSLTAGTVGEYTTHTGVNLQLSCGSQVQPKEFEVCTKWASGLLPVLVSTKASGARIKSVWTDELVDYTNDDGTNVMQTCVNGLEI